MSSPAQDKARICADASVSTRNALAPAPASPPTGHAGDRRPGGVLFSSCPCCEGVPREPVLLEGQMACRACTSSCELCGDVSFPGDEVCGQCRRHLRRETAA